MAASAAPTTGRLASIDMVKGWAIVGVTFIHSWVLGNSLWMTMLFFHAVPVFLVLFGTNSETWFRRRSPHGRTREWYVRGVKRILVPAYAAALFWWLMIAILRPPEPMVRITLGLPFWHAIGYFHQIGTSWFITLILQLVVLFPLFHWLARRAGRMTVLALGAAFTAATLLWVHSLRGALGVGGWLVFAPRFFLHVAFGILLADRVERIGGRAALLAGTLLVPCYLIQQKLWLPDLWRVADRFLELPLTVALLWVMSRLAEVEWLERGLGWLGRHSFGLYLGQMLTHNGFLYRFGGACDLFGCYGGLFDKLNLWLYTAILLAGSITFVLLGNRLVELNQSLRARGYPLPDLAI
jgi:peptidoglycan/LPS O-acetylase OafA/YrhL